MGIVLIPITNLNPAQIKNKTILIRVDFNVPIKEGKIIDKNRIYNSISTIKYFFNSSKIVLITHFGRPSGIKNPKLSVKFLQKELDSIFNKKIYFCKEAIGNERNDKIKNLKNGE